ncbi:MAG: helix-turn-helix domain-containing protein [Spirosomataceae bacterium]
MEKIEMYLVPKSYLDKLEESQKKILSMLEGGQTTSTTSVGNYVPEPEAMRLLGRKSTWFWQQRTSGELAYSKVGNKIYYSRLDILALLDKNRKKIFRTKKR